jgi:hypothetical protein
MLLQRPFLLLAAVTLLLAPFTVTTDFDCTSAYLLFHRTLIVPAISVKYSGQATVEVYINTTPIKNSMGNNTGDGLHDTIRASLRSVCPDTTANNCQRLSAARIPSKKALPDGSFAGKFAPAVLSQDRANDSSLHINLETRYSHLCRIHSIVLQDQPGS